MQEMRWKGMVEYYNAVGGYGFVVPYGRTEPVHFERSAFCSGLTCVAEGQQISFRIVLGNGRFEAQEIEP